MPIKLNKRTFLLKATWFSSISCFPLLSPLYTDESYPHLTCLSPPHPFSLFPYDFSLPVTSIYLGLLCSATFPCTGSLQVALWSCHQNIYPIHLTLSTSSLPSSGTHWPPYGFYFLDHSISLILSWVIFFFLGQPGPNTNILELWLHP
jgi:hypothetical protein